MSPEIARPPSIHRLTEQRYGTTVWSFSPTKPFGIYSCKLLSKLNGNVKMDDGGELATLEDFEKLDIRVGKVIEVTPFPEGRYSSHILRIDFGPELGVKKSLAKLAPNYESDSILGRQVLSVVNFPPRQIGKHQSEVLTLGLPDENDNVVLLRPDRDVPSGGRVY